MTPSSVLAAIQAVSGRIVCVEAPCGAIVVTPGAGTDDPPELHHPYAGCVCVTRPDGPEANALAEYALEEMARYIIVGDYGEDLPRNRWAVA